LQAESATASTTYGCQKVAFTIKEAARASGISRSFLYVAIGRGALRARKCGARTLILDADLRRFLRSLPRLKKSDTASNSPKTPPGPFRRGKPGLAA
jgi:excisionase family DNA binding protein